MSSSGQIAQIESETGGAAGRVFPPIASSSASGCTIMQMITVASPDGRKAYLCLSGFDFESGFANSQAVPLSDRQVRALRAQLEQIAPEAHAREESEAAR